MTPGVLSWFSNSVIIPSRTHLHTPPLLTSTPRVKSYPGSSVAVRRSWIRRSPRRGLYIDSLDLSYRYPSKQILDKPRPRASYPIFVYTSPPYAPARISYTLILPIKPPLRYYLNYTFPPRSTIVQHSMTLIPVPYAHCTTAHRIPPYSRPYAMTRLLLEGLFILDDGGVCL